MQKPIVQLPTATCLTMHDELVPWVKCNSQGLFAVSLASLFSRHFAMCPGCVPYIPAQPRHDEKD